MKERQSKGGKTTMNRVAICPYYQHGCSCDGRIASAKIYGAFTNGGKAVVEKYGTDHFKQLAACRKQKKGGRPQRRRVE